MSDQPSKHSRPIYLSAPQRLIAGVGGCGLIGVGGWGMIASGHDGAGTVAFVAAGTVSALLGVVGRMPSRLTGKDYGMEWSDDFERVADQLTVEQKSQLVSEAYAEGRKEEGPVDLLELLEASLGFDYAARNFLNRCLDVSGLTNWIVNQRGKNALGELSISATISVSGKHTVYVVFRQRTSIASEQRYLEAISSMNRHPASVTGRAVLFLVGNDIKASGLRVVSPLSPTPVRRLVVGSHVGGAIETLREMDTKLLSEEWTRWQLGERAPDI